MNKSKTACILKFATGLVTLLVVAYLAIVALALWDFRQRRVELQAEGTSPLTESQAIELSREALKRVGEDAKMLEPVSYDHDNTKLYARNSLTPYSGYVLWHSLGAPTRCTFSVHLEQVGSEVRCEVGRCK